MNSKISVSESRHPNCVLSLHQDFTIDGDVSASTDSDDYTKLYRDTLIYATGENLEPRPSPKIWVTCAGDFSTPSFVTRDAVTCDHLHIFEAKLVARFPRTYEWSVRNVEGLTDLAMM